ncbi:hypothetical protein QTQ03_29940 [Micromonospora sp. WMMA1363]|nr:hypothetical protein [Micromonospora sp. WMMA1363]MDM4723566.1 hypothetical protein [Micromonospora sp. WMMA1363]MDM4723585.1 hypothetical protein [Micromonospora sp. WMMA1363]
MTQTTNKIKPDDEEPAEQLRRRHSICDWRSPADYERSTAGAVEAQAA